MASSSGVSIFVLLSSDFEVLYNKMEPFVNYVSGRCSFNYSPI